MIGILVLVIIMIAAIYNAGWVATAIVAVTCTAVSVGIYQLRKFAAKQSPASFYCSLSRFLTALVKVGSVILLIIGILLFVIGIFTAEDTLSFSGDRCGICGGTGRFFGAECRNCYGSGYAFERGALFANATWSGVLIAAGSLVTFMSANEPIGKKKSDK